MNKIEKFISDFLFDKNVIFDGNTGVGKTFIMQSLYKKLPENEGRLHKYWIEDGKIREFITSGNFSLRKVSDNVSILNYPFEMCIRVKVLFIDDFGSSLNVSESQMTKIKYILDEREQKGLVTIISTNVSPKNISELYGERIKSRIYNGKSKKGLLLINIPGEDRRKEDIQTMTL